MVKFEDVSQSVYAGNIVKVKEQVQAMINDGANPLDIINQGLIGGMNIVAPLFKSGEMFVPEVMRSAKTMAIGMELVKPLIADKDVPTKGKIVFGTVKGDLHDIGKNLVGMMMESSGYTVVDLGVDIPEEKFVEAVREHNPDIVAMSALLTTTMMKLKDTIEVLKIEGLRENVKVIIGGAPVTQDFADKIQADGYSEDAVSAVELCDRLMSL